MPVPSAIEAIKTEFDFGKLETLAKDKETPLKEKLVATRALADAVYPTQKHDLFLEHPLLAVYCHANHLLAAGWLNLVVNEQIDDLMRQLALFHAMVECQWPVTDQLAAAKAFEEGLKIARQHNKDKDMGHLLRQPLFTKTPTPAKFIDKYNSKPYVFAQLVLRSDAIVCQWAANKEAASQHYLDYFAQLPLSWRRDFLLQKETHLSTFRHILQSVIDLKKLEEVLKQTQDIDALKLKKSRDLRLIAKWVPSVPKEDSEKLFGSPVLVTFHQLLLGGALVSDFQNSKEPDVRRLLPIRAQEYINGIKCAPAYQTYTDKRIVEYFNKSFQSRIDKIYFQMHHALELVQGRKQETLTVSDYEPYFKVLTMLEEQRHNILPLSAQASRKNLIAVFPDWDGLVHKLAKAYTDTTLTVHAGFQVMERCLAALKSTPLTDHLHIFPAFLPYFYAYALLFFSPATRSLAAEALEKLENGKQRQSEAFQQLQRHLEYNIDKVMPQSSVKLHDFLCFFVLRAVLCGSKPDRFSSIYNKFLQRTNQSYLWHCESRIMVEILPQERWKTAMAHVKLEANHNWATNSKELAQHCVKLPQDPNQDPPKSKAVFECTVKVCQQLAKAYWEANVGTTELEAREAYLGGVVWLGRYYKPKDTSDTRHFFDWKYAGEEEKAKKRAK